MPLGFCGPHPGGGILAVLVVWVPLCSLGVFPQLQARTGLLGAEPGGRGVSCGWSCSWGFAGAAFGIPPAQLMQEPGVTEEAAEIPPADPEVESVTLNLAGLQLTITARRLDQTTAVSAEASASAAAATTTPPVSEILADPYNISTALEEEIIPLREPEALRIVNLPFLTYLENRLRSTTGPWVPRARLARAFRAGVIARRQLDGVFQAGTSPNIPYKNSVYIVLREPGNLVTGFWTTSFAVYTRRTRGYHRQDFHPDCVSHAFASQSEVEAYLIGARRLWPPVAA